MWFVRPRLKAGLFKTSFPVKKVWQEISYAKREKRAWSLVTQFQHHSLVQISVLADPIAVGCPLSQTHPEKDGIQGPTCPQVKNLPPYPCEGIDHEESCRVALYLQCAWCNILKLQHREVKHWKSSAPLAQLGKRRKGKWKGKDWTRRKGNDTGWAVRGRWAPRPMQGRGKGKEGK